MLYNQSAVLRRGAVPDHSRSESLGGFSLHIRPAVEYMYHLFASTYLREEIHRPYDTLSADKIEGPFFFCHRLN